MIIVNYKECTLGITSKDQEDEVTVYGFKNIDGEYFVKQTVFAESINEDEMIQDLCSYVDEMQDDYSVKGYKVIESEQEQEIDDEDQDEDQDEA